MSAGMEYLVMPVAVVCAVAAAWRVVSSCPAMHWQCQQLLLVNASPLLLLPQVETCIPVATFTQLIDTRYLTAALPAGLMFHTIDL